MEAARVALARGLAEIGAVKRGRFVLSSGRESSVYVDLRIVPAHPALYRLALSLLHAEAYPFTSRGAGLLGVATGGVPWAAGLAVLSGAPMGYVRPERKGHGRGRLVEYGLPAGSRVVLVDDVATTGGSLLRAAEAVEREGYTVEAALVLVDRGEGARERLREAGVELRSVLGLAELMEALEEA